MYKPCILLYVPFYSRAPERDLFVFNYELKMVEKRIGHAKALGKCLVLLNGLRDGGAYVIKS